MYFDSNKIKLKKKTPKTIKKEIKINFKLMKKNFY